MIFIMALFVGALGSLLVLSVAYRKLREQEEESQEPIRQKLQPVVESEIVVTKEYTVSEEVHTVKSQEF